MTDWNLESEGSYIGYCYVAIRWMHYSDGPQTVGLAFGKGNGVYFRVGPEDGICGDGESITENDYRAEITHWVPLDHPPSPPTVAAAENKQDQQ